MIMPGRLVNPADAGRGIGQMSNSLANDHAPVHDHEGAACRFGFESKVVLGKIPT